MLEADLLQSTLEHALRNGGDFAEVFVEDRRSSSARFDDGRVEELVSGRERGAGIAQPDRKVALSEATGAEQSQKQRKQICGASDQRKEQ